MNLTTIDDLNAALLARFTALPATSSRTRAWNTFNETGLPSKRLEAWRWSDLSESFGEAITPHPATTRAASSTLPLNGIEITLNDTQITWPDDLPAGLSISQSNDKKTNAGPINAAALADLAAALSDTINIEVTHTLDQPIIIKAKSASNSLLFGQINAIVRTGASVEIIELYDTATEFGAIAINWQVEQGAKLNRHALLLPQKASNRLTICADITLSEQSELTQNLLNFGAKWSRFETDVNFAGRQGKATLNAASLVGDGYHADCTTRVIHGAQSCETRQLHRTAARAGAKAIFQGKFIVPRDIGQFTDAKMAHDALLLENGAAVFAKPELEIYADDVECAHGNTNGSLDPNALFYARQRGIPEVQARAILTYAFIAEALTHAPDFFTKRAGEWLGIDEVW